MRKTLTGIIVLSILILGVTAVSWADVKSGSTAQTRDIVLMEEDAAPGSSTGEIQVQELHKNDFVTTIVSDRPDGIYNIGDNIILRFTSERDAYVTVLDFTPSGQIVVLFPNKWVADNHVKAGETVIIPAEGQNFSLKAGGPVGVDVVKAIATNNREQVYDDANKDLAGPFSVLKDPKVATRDILLLAEEQPASPADGTPAQPLEWSVSSLALMTKDEEDNSPTGFTAGSSGDWQVKMWTNRNNFLVGERVFVKLLSNKDGRLTSLLNAGASSSENNLLPEDSSVVFKAGEVLILPRADDKWKLVSAEKAGVDGIKAELALNDGTKLEIELGLTVEQD
ncbi:MAG: DUF4384 domain-containing protein [Synergistaceae bacterium]|jgi:hypothetical protein|nr:DUF4384 domain-containing protein [Synergistaceae bacterium]